MKSDAYVERKVPTLEPSQEAVKSDELPLVRVVIECNTFDFYVKEADRRRKRVTVMQHTDFAGTILAKLLARSRSPLADLFLHSGSNAGTG